MSRRSVVIHGHFYQPPREDPWTGRVPLQKSAAPHHDWNARVHDECYRAVVAARMLDDRGRIIGVVNALAWMSWDAGPTLLEWMAREEPATYRAFLEADRLARARTGHGGALATPYHHVILPLASRREKRTEVRWGMADFRRRFGREPEGMWLPEAAVDTETLEVLAEEGIRFTVLGPGQVRSSPRAGRPGRIALPKGRSVSVFVYDGPLSHDVAFGAVLHDSSRWLERLVHAHGHPELVAAATDGETFGHHHRWGEMALAATLAAAARHPGLRVDNFGSFLERHPAVEAVELVEPSSWSCAHGVERWRSACGCKIEPGRPTQQEWRSVLRDALEELATALHESFEHEGNALFADPWAALDAYGAVQGAGPDVVAAFVRAEGKRALDAREITRAIELLDMQRDVLRMRTSCAWFFDDVARLEPLQNLLYAAHALDLVGKGAAKLERALVHRLEGAHSNDPAEGTAAQMWRTQVRGARPDEAVEAPAKGTLALTLAVGRAIDEPSTQAVDAALAALATSPSPDRFDAQSLVARDVARRGTATGPSARLAEGLGVAREVSGHALPVEGPVRFVFGLHVHQPVGNFEEVFRSHVEEVYLPLLERCAERSFLPVALHVSGPLLEWLEGRGHRYLDEVGRLVADGAVEPLLAGFYEPVLPALSREDRIEQIGWMREWLRTRFGADARGLWLTERVWEPGLARDLADAGVEHVLLDDRHFLVAGIERRALDRPWRTEADGRSLAVLPIDERLRYLIPFRSPGEIGDYFRRLAAGGHAVAVLADDGEKFGGWPGTAEWVWGKGWLGAFLDEMERLTEQGVVKLATPSEVVRDVPAAGLAYLPTASYREMELWSLPPLAASTLERAGELLADEPEAAGSLRGGHWRGFLAKYDESNRMHKKAQVLSERCRAAGDPAGARRAIGRAQCNDPYWHGVFGGLYLRHLRDAIWQNLAEAERILRRGEKLALETLDLDGDGAPELWVHSHAFSAVLSPHRGGTLVELTDLSTGVNLANVLTRRRESYHRVDSGTAHAPHAPEEGAMPSIHEIEEGLRVDQLPPVDLDVRAILVDRVLPGDLDPGAYVRAEYTPLHSWSRDTFLVEASVKGSVTIAMRSTGLLALEKTLTFFDDGAVEVEYRWDPAALPANAWFAPELSLEIDPGVTFEPPPAEVWRHDIVTMSKRESGLEETVQGTSVTPLWPCALGSARVTIPSQRVS
ncbi:MAG: alpha-amylase/4-alpha-glucanotransferase domain-containing protein [Longimicrobiales bacterium]